MPIAKNKLNKLAKPSAFLHFIEEVEDEEVHVKYDLETSYDVSIRGFYIGYTEVDLLKDQDPINSDHFRTKDSKSYACTWREKGLRVVMFATGMAGDKWTLKIKIKRKGETEYKDIKANPIEQTTDNNGHIDTNKFYK